MSLVSCLVSSPFIHFLLLLYSESNNNNKNIKNELLTFCPVFSASFPPPQLMAHNTTVQLGGTAFLVCKVSGVDRVGVNWVCFCLSNWAA